MRRITSLLVAAAMAAATLTAGAGSTDAAPSTSGHPLATRLCRTLRDMQRGRIVSHEEGELDQVTDLLDHLVPLADEPLRSDLTTMRTTFAAVGVAEDAGTSILPAFAALTSPSLIDVEQRVADGLNAACGNELAPPTSSSSTGGLQPSICPGWPGQGNIYTSNRFPFTIDTSGANYWSFNTPVSPGGWVEVHGEYPQARYFSLLPNDADTNNLHQQTDAFIDPDVGSANPFRGPVPAGIGRSYTVRFRFSAPPAVPEPNTSYVGVKQDGTTPNPTLTVVYRIYGSDLGNLPNSAGAPLPAITYYDAAGNVVRHYDECDPFPNGTPPPPAAIQRFPSLPIPGPRADRRPSLSLSSNWHAPVDLLANPDVLYASAFYSRRHGDLFVVRAKAFNAPDTRHGQPVWTPGHDIRGVTVCGYNFYAGFANRCVLDNDIAVDAEGYYTLVISPADRRPANADAAHGVTWIDSGSYLDGQLVYRFFLRGDDKIQQLRNAITTGQPSASIAPYVPQMNYCATERFERSGPRACFRNGP
jgi:hypothetical protein